MLILTPGNTADCVMAQDCVSLIPGIKELLADKGYDTDAFRAFLKKEGIKPVIPGKSNRKKRIRHDKKAYKNAMSSSAAWEGSRTSAASPRAMTSSLETSFPRFVSLQSLPIGFELIESGPSQAVSMPLMGIAGLEVCTVELYAKIRHAVTVDGLSRREAAKRFGVHRNTDAPRRC